MFRISTPSTLSDLRGCDCLIVVSPLESIYSTVALLYHCMMLIMEEIRLNLIRYFDFLYHSQQVIHINALIRNGPF